MAKCKFCGADVEVGAKCSYCGSIAERWYYPDYKEDKKPEKKDTGIKSRLTIPVNSYYNVKMGITCGIFQRELTVEEICIITL